MEARQGHTEGQRLMVIARHMDMIQSYAISAQEAARRGEMGVLEIHIQQLRRELLEAIAQFKALR